MNKQTIRYNILLLVVAILTFSCTTNNTPKQSGSKTKIKIAYLPLTHALPLLVENEFKDSLKDVDFELIKFSSWPELVEALNTGSVDGASILAELAIKSKEKGIDLKAVALGHRDGNVVIVANDINSANDLKGKTFAIPHRMSTHNILLHQVLKNAGISIKDINLLELAPPEMPAALAEKRISGYIVAEPFGAKSVALGKGKVLYQSSDLWKNSICCALVLRNDFITKNRKTAQEFVNGYVKAGEYLNSNNEESKKIAAKYLTVSQDVLDLSLRWISFNNLEINTVDYTTLIDYMKELNLVEKAPTYEEFVDNSLITQALKQ
jgi:NitT/TauT family transport system substrate-binding protein